MIADAAWLHRLISVRDRTGQVPHAYFNWTEGNPVLYMIHYVLSGYGDWILSEFPLQILRFEKLFALDWL